MKLFFCWLIIVIPLFIIAEVWEGKILESEHCQAVRVEGLMKHGCNTYVLCREEFFNKPWILNYTRLCYDNLCYYDFDKDINTSFIEEWNTTSNIFARLSLRNHNRSSLH
jgi:hypothetical protein